MKDKFFNRYVNQALLTLTFSVASSLFKIDGWYKEGNPRRGRVVMSFSFGADVFSMYLVKIDARNRK